MAQIVKKETSTLEGGLAKSSLSELIATREVKDVITETLGKNRVQTFVGSALTVAQDSKLKDVEPNSLFSCLLKAATYNLPIDPNLGFVFPVPYKNDNGLKIAQFQMGTKGIIELALRSGQYQRLNVKDVKEGELLGYDFFGEAEIKWIIKGRDKLPVIGYMAAYELTNGMRKRTYWDIAKLKEHAKKYSKAHQNALRSGKTGDDLWSNSFAAMAEKTVLKDLLKYAPKSMELQNALLFDQSVIRRENGVETPMYVDNDSSIIEINANTSYDIDNETGEVITSTKEKTKTSAKKITATENTEIVEENEEGIEYIDYDVYSKNKEQYVRAPYSDGRDPYDKITRKIRVRIK